MNGLTTNTKKLVYIAGPYTAPTKALVKENIKAADNAAALVLLMGHIPVTPHKITSFFDLRDDVGHWTHDDWLVRFCLPLLKRCDVILLVEGWRSSKGASHEYMFALHLGTEIWHQRGGTIVSDKILLKENGDYE